MSDMNRYSLLIESYAELKPEIEATRQLTPVIANPSLSEVISEFGAMPREALFMGVASDGLPMLLNLHDSVPGPILVTGDAGAGKTDLLQIIARAAGIMHGPGTVQYGVLTSHPEEWSGFDRVAHNVGIFPLFATASQEFLQSLASWAHSQHSGSQCVLLLLDDLEAATHLDFEALQNLRWLLLRGPARRVWPIVTLNPDRSDGLQPWLDAFRTRIFGSIKDERHIRQLSASDANLKSLRAGSQFALREGEHWLRFWIPTLD